MRRLLITLSVAALAALRCEAQPAPATRTYYVGFLRPNPARKPLETAERKRIMEAHMANIHKMADDGVLAAAGPMEDDPTTISGIFVFRTASLAEAVRIGSLDPTVAEGRNTLDIHTWLGPAAVGDAYFQWKKDDPAAEDVMAAHAFCILLRKAPPRLADTETDAQDEEFVDSLRASGLLAAAGRTEGDPSIAGIVIFKSDSIDEARKAMAGDPAVAAGRMTPEFHRWWSADRVLPW